VGSDTSLSTRDWDYWITTVFLRDGRQINNVTIVGGLITDVDGKKEIPFIEEEIVDIRVMNVPKRH